MEDECFTIRRSSPEQHLENLESVCESMATVAAFYPPLLDSVRRAVTAAVTPFIAEYEWSARGANL